MQPVRHGTDRLRRTQWTTRGTAPRIADILGLDVSHAEGAPLPLGAIEQSSVYGAPCRLRQMVERGREPTDAAPHRAGRAAAEMISPHPPGVPVVAVPAPHVAVPAHAARPRPPRTTRPRAGRA
ncbi:hypothetical protein ACF09H_11685 [Streptomyces sp. NPDC014983]|uniref:hypothetical protein n=1 Tax=Streptomyces sp. NPDC014983 TaxID=3364933 RepID=UPI0037017A80